MRLTDKLTILADAAKYDVSCASSGSSRSNTPRGLGNAATTGICHSFTEDGRCVSLLKILLSNICVYDCAYCVNRRSNDVARAAFTPQEVIDLTLGFYRRNYIEGLFLSSGVIQSPDDTMLRLIRTVRGLRDQGFNGYIHLKCVPHASQELVEQAGLHADRLSVNIELPSEASLARLTPEKTYASILTPMAIIRDGIAQHREDRRRLRHTPSFAPGGQSTQLIVGASPESDCDILHLAQSLYTAQQLKRVYYSAFIQTLPQDADPAVHGPPLRREHRLYQADWLLRYYQFSLDEIITPEAPHLDLTRDPKHAYALRHPELFPVDLNRADYELLLRVPGIGLRSAQRIVHVRRRGRVRLEHLRDLGIVVRRALPFLICDGKPRPEDEVVITLASQTAATAERLVFVTDGSFEGLLCAIWTSYGPEGIPALIASGGQGQAGLFERRVAIATHAHQARRVWQGLERHLGANARRLLVHAFLSEEAEAASLICHFVRQRVASRSGLRLAADPTLQLRLTQLAAKVRREAHRMKGFLRFQQLANGTYLALCAPRYDVLPLVHDHFALRLGEQPWCIYDTLRQSTLVHTGELYPGLPPQVRQVFETTPLVEEAEQQALWQAYNQAVTISQRANPRLEHSKLPRRYWRFLTEKQGRASTRAKPPAPPSARDQDPLLPS